jgi:hypothetical protein
MKWTDLLGIGWSAMGAPDSRLVMLLHGAQVISGEQGEGRRMRNRSELVCCWHQIPAGFYITEDMKHTGHSCK